MTEEEAPAAGTGVNDGEDEPEVDGCARAITGETG